MLKDLHRLPPLPQGQTSVLTRYFTANNTAAQRLRAVGRVRLRLDAFRSFRLSFCAHHAFNDAILSKTPDIMPGQYR